jgi:hypothetical protein
MQQNEGACLVCTTQEHKACCSHHVVLTSLWCEAPAGVSTNQKSFLIVHTLVLGSLLHSVYETTFPSWCEAPAGVNTTLGPAQCVLRLCACACTCACIWMCKE